MNKKLMEDQGGVVREEDEDEVFVLDENGKSVKLEVPDDEDD